MLYGVVFPGIGNLRLSMAINWIWRSISAYLIPFHLWFRVVAPNRSLLAESPPETRLSVWQKNKPSLFAQTWEEFCRQSVPLLQKSDSPLAERGPWGPARRYWRGNSPEWDLVARSLDGRRLLLGEVKYHAQRATTGMVQRAANALLRKGVPDIPGCKDCDIVHAVFFPGSTAPGTRCPGAVKGKVNPDLLRFHLERRTLEMMR